LSSSAAGSDVGAYELLDFGEPRLGDASECRDQTHHVRARHLVEDPQTLLACPHQPHAAQFLQMLRGVRDGKPRHGCEFLHTARPLRNQLQKLQPVAVRQHLADPRELGEYVPLEISC
jgi:hypothetical protein